MRDLGVLRTDCKSFSMLKHGDWYYANGRPEYQLNNPPYRWRVELICANGLAFRQLAQRRDTSLTYVEFARDSIFSSPDGPARMQEAFDYGFVQPWQRQNKRQSWPNGGSSTGRRKFYFTWYRDAPSRLTGELNCFHLEARASSARKLKALGIATVRDLVSFDHSAFWSDKIALYDINLERLGRYYRNKKRRWTDQDGYGGRSYDFHTGKVLWRAHGYDDTGVLSIQTFITNFGRGPFLRRVTSMSIP